MTNVLIECYSSMPSYELTVRDFRRYSTKIPISVRAKMTRDISDADIRWCDVLCSVRGYNPLSRYVVNEASKVGRKVILMLDDDLMIAKTSGNNLVDTTFKESLLGIISKSECILTSSKYLGEKYKKMYGIDYFFCDTILDPMEIKKRKPENEYSDNNPIKLLYAASPLHAPFYNELIKPIVGKLFERYGEKISFTIVGPDVEEDYNGRKIVKYPSMPFNQYRKFMDEHDFDIGLAPLFDAEFCKSKYYNKYLEYSKNNICGVYSNVMPYNLIVKDGENGLMVDNSPEGWYCQLCRAIDSVELRKKCVETSQVQMLNDFSLENLSNRLYHGLHDVFNYNAPAYHNKTCRSIRLRYLSYMLQRRVYALTGAN